MYDYQLDPIKGSYNKVADALSRRVDYLGALVTEFDISNDLTRSLVEAYQGDAVMSEIIRKFQAKDKKTLDEFTMVDGLLFLEKAGFKRLCVPDSESLRSLFLGECHDAVGHFGYKKISANLVQKFWWPSMMKDAKLYVETCQVCQSDKPRTQAPLGLIKPLPIPEGPGPSVSMNFMDTLVTSKTGKRHIFVRVDRFTKYARLIAMPETTKSDHVIKLFMDNWVRDFGLPTSIVSDRDVRFTSELWQSTAEQMKTKLQMTSGNHPESNGQAEQMNRVVQHLLRHYIKPSQDDWDDKLPLVANLYNNAVHSATGMTPNQLHLGWKPRTALDFLLPERESTAAPGSIEFAVKYEQMLQQAVEHIRKTQDAMIASENKHRRPSNFQEHELLEHFQPPISDALLRNRFNDDRQLRFDIQQVNVPAPSVADLAVYSLLAQRVTYAGVYVDISPVPGQESTRVFIEFRAIQVSTNFVHSIATFIGDLTVLPGHDPETTYRFLRDYALQVARSVARVQARGTHRFTAYEVLLRRTPEGALALLPQLPALLPPAEPLNIQAVPPPFLQNSPFFSYTTLPYQLTQLPYPMRNFPEYLVELTDVEQLPPPDEDAWELHRALYSSVVLGMFTFFVEHEVHNVGEFFHVYYVIFKPKPERKEGTVALYPFGRIGTNRPGLLQLIHIELLSIAQVVAAEEEDLQLRLWTASAPCRSYNAAVILNYLARKGESVVDFGHEDKPLRPPSSYPKPAALKAPRKRTVPKQRRSPSPEA
ncbi:hypothetical protein CBR_g42156 [Chara braunii]|uniref:Integrase catalytic domain-containing protein n=1 Tax=Chara braunii TaxID=69332 RepID=A0A388LXC1_CHABU|nr:hypothetical protein CBR_g42156 [Chara braunii]|eukprot:GBG86872.1 hypothetical protein CBR_g42156 [Chara braunii]